MQRSSCSLPRLPRSIDLQWSYRRARGSYDTRIASVSEEQLFFPYFVGGYGFFPHSRARLLSYVTLKPYSRDSNSDPTSRLHYWRPTYQPGIALGSLRLWIMAVLASDRSVCKARRYARCIPYPSTNGNKPCFQDVSKTLSSNIHPASSLVLASY